MSRAFVKEQDGDDVRDELPERPQSTYPNYVTPRGLAQLRSRHQALLEKRAALAGSDDALARQALGQVERDLRWIAGRLERAILVDASRQDDEDEVRFGCRVLVREPDGSLQHYTIVGEDEADAANHLVSWASPLGRALLGARVGDLVVWRRPAGDYELEIEAVELPKQD